MEEIGEAPNSVDVVWMFCHDQFIEDTKGAYYA